MLTREFYLRSETLLIGKELLGKRLVTRIGGVVTSALITEIEAYLGETDRASHAFGGRRTRRTEIMYAIGGTAYVYLCYGMHSLFNIVTNHMNCPHAILIRSVEPEKGIETMLQRSGKNSLTSGIGRGPGRLSKLLGIEVKHSGLDLILSREDTHKPAIWIEDAGISIPPSFIETTPRIGIDYAGEDVNKPYRFVIKKGATLKDAP